MMCSKSFSLWALLVVISAGCASPRFHEQTLVEGSSLRGVNSLSAGSDGIIYAASPFSNQIAAIDPHTLQWNFISSQPIAMPWELATTGDESFAIYDSVRNRLDTYSPVNGLTPIKRKASAKMKLAATTDGRLFAAVMDAPPRLEEIDPHNGKQLFLISDKTGPTTSLIASSNERLLVAQGGPGQISRVDTITGRFDFIAKGLGDVSAMAETDSGVLWVSSRVDGQPRLWRLDSQTGERRSVDCPVIFNAMASTGDKVICGDTIGNSLWAISPEVDTPVEFFQSPMAAIGGLCLLESPGEGDHRLFVADHFSVKEFNPVNGQAVRTFEIPPFMGQTVYPTNIESSGDRIVATSWISGTVHILNPDSGAVEWVGGNLQAPQSAVILPGGDVLVAELASGHIVRLSRSDNRQNTIITTEIEGPRGPCGLALAPGGGVYVTENFGGGVSFVDPYAFVYKPIVTGLEGPEGLTVLPSGDLLVIEANTRRLLRISPQSGDVETLSSNLPVGLEPLPGLPPSWFYSGVAVARDGRIYLSCDRDNSIRVLTPR